MSVGHLSLHWFTTAAGHEIRDWLSAITTAAAAMLALVAIVQTKRQAKASADNLVRERRLDWELDILRELADLADRNPVANETVLQRLRLLAPFAQDDLPMVRARFDFQADRADIERVDRARVAMQHGDDSTFEALQAVWRDEVRTAIQRRLTERGR